MPTRTRPSSGSAHSWSWVYRRSSGTSIRNANYSGTDGVGGLERRWPGQGGDDHVGVAVDLDLHPLERRERLDRAAPNGQPAGERGRVADGGDPVRRLQAAPVEGDSVALREEGARRSHPLLVDREGLGAG